jgi:hypothetical protein
MRAVAVLAVVLCASSCGGGEDAPSGVGPDKAGPSGPKPPGAACSVDAECESTCTAGKCAVPTTTDNKKSPSLGETDIDCGGPSAPPCNVGKVCAEDRDCATKVCGATKLCVLARSCGGTDGPAGIDTCGTGEPGAAGAVVESCCKSFPLPTTKTRRLDRYEITSGRVRTFVSALAAANGGVPNVRAFAKAEAQSKPTSQLGKIATSHPGLLDVLPEHNDPRGVLPIQPHLGAIPIDAINTLDGCFVGTNAYGHATYWQPPGDLAPFGVGYGSPPDGKRKLAREVIDAKPINCVMPLFLAAFCAWDGGELARTTDYREVWGRKGVTVGGATVFIPWTALLRVGRFNWRNGHGGNCPIAAWPGCVDNPPSFYQSPTGIDLSADDTPSIGAPGRFPDDVTAARSESGEAWYDVGGNMMEAAWPNTALDAGAQQINDVCDTSAGPTPGNTCTRVDGRQGTRRFTGPLPNVALVGYSFEGHLRRSEAYLSSTTEDEGKLIPGDIKPVTFQYGKVGGRCARSN